jgi:hypothetical protein
MFGGRSMAGLTSDIFVIGRRLEFINSVMTIVAGRRPGVDYFLRLILFNGLRPIMSQNPKTGRYEDLPGDYKKNGKKDESDPDAYELLRNFPKIFQWMPSNLK